MKFLILEAVDHFSGTWSTSHQMPLELLSYKALNGKWVILGFECSFCDGNGLDTTLGQFQHWDSRESWCHLPDLTFPAKDTQMSISLKINAIPDGIAEWIKCATSYPATDLGSGISACRPTLAQSLFQPHRAEIIIIMGSFWGFFPHFALVKSFPANNAHIPKGTDCAASRLENTVSPDTTQGLSHNYPNWPVSWEN